MTVRGVVCVILIRSLVVAAYPTSDNDGDPVLIELPVSGVAEFSGTAPATGSVTIVGHAPCPELLLPSNLNKPILTQAIDNEKASKLTEFDEPSSPKFHDNDEINSNNPIPKKVILGAILADSFMREKGAEIDAKLAKVDAFVEKELEMVGPIIQTTLVNADTSEIDSSVDSTLLEMQSQISTELTKLDEFIESELAETEELIESVIRNVETYTANNEENVSAEKDPRIELDLAMLESFVESALKKSEALIESELEKVNSLVESELTKVDSVVESELHNVDLFIERKLAKTDAAVKSKLSKMESIVNDELLKLEKSIDDIADSVTASSDHVCLVSNSDGNAEEETNEDQGRTIAIDGTFHVTGRTVITGSTGCPSPFATGEPLPLYVESFPVFETEDDESFQPEILPEDIIHDEYDDDDGCIIELPVKGVVGFSGTAPAVGTCKILGACSCDSLVPSINSIISPPTVGDANPIIPLKQAGPYNEQYFTISENNEPNAEPDVCLVSNSDGNAEEDTNEDQVRTIAIDGTFHVTGRTVIIGSTGCPSPFATGEPLPLYVESFPVFETEDDESFQPEILPEDIIHDEYDDDDGCIVELPVKGVVVFSGTAPAVGTCKILGACPCDSLVPSINSIISPPTVGDANPIIPLKQAGPYNEQYFTISENNEPNAEPDSVMYHKKQLPMVNLRNLLRAGQKPIGAVILKGDLEFSGNAEALGGTSLSAHFPCQPLTASEEGPDGKKHIWISKKPKLFTNTKDI